MKGIIHAETIASSDKNKPYQVKIVHKDTIIILRLYWMEEPTFGDSGRKIKKHYF